MCANFGIGREWDLTNTSVPAIPRTVFAGSNIYMSLLSPLPFEAFEPPPPSIFDLSPNAVGEN